MGCILYWKKGGWEKEKAKYSNKVNNKKETFLSVRQADHTTQIQQRLKGKKGKNTIVGGWRGM